MTRKHDITFHAQINFLSSFGAGFRMADIDSTSIYTNI